MQIVNPNWIKKKQTEIDSGYFVSETVSYNPAAQWLITKLAANNRPVEVINLGAGVKRITLAEKVCPECKGKGYLK